MGPITQTANMKTRNFIILLNLVINLYLRLEMDVKIWHYLKQSKIHNKKNMKVKMKYMIIA